MLLAVWASGPSSRASNQGSRRPSVPAPGDHVFSHSQRAQGQSDVCVVTLLRSFITQGLRVENSDNHVLFSGAPSIWSIGAEVRRQVFVTRSGQRRFTVRQR